MYKFIKITCLILVIVGALNWGLVGAFNFDLVAKLFGDMSIISRAVYALVGVSGLILLIMLPICCAKYKDNM
jgi:uncharacterized protein